MKDIVIIGTGGFAREVLFLLEQNNKKQNEWNILGFIDNEYTGDLHGYPVIGNDDWLKNYSGIIYAACGVGSPKIKRKIVEQFKEKENIIFPNLIANGVVGDFDNIAIGRGCILCEGNILTTDIKLGSFVTVNISCTIGHDTVIGDYVTINPGSNISGNVTLGAEADVGTGSLIIQGKTVGDNAILGAGAVVVRDIPSGCTAVGVPAKIIKGMENKI